MYCCVVLLFLSVLNTGTCSRSILLSAVGRTASTHMASFVSPCFRSMCTLSFSFCEFVIVSSQSNLRISSPPPPPLVVLVLVLRRLLDIVSPFLSRAAFSQVNFACGEIVLAMLQPYILCLMRGYIGHEAMSCMSLERSC